MPSAAEIHSVAHKYTNDTLIYYSHRKHRWTQILHEPMARWLKKWREMLLHNVSVVCRALSSESSLSSDMALQMTYRCSGLHLATPSIYEWNFRYIFLIMVMNFGHYSLNIWRDSLNKESVSGRLLTLESLLSDGSKLILTIGAVLHIYKYLIHSWKWVCIRGSK